MRRFRGLALFIGALLAVSCAKPGDPVKASLDEVTSAVQRRSARDVAGHLMEDFQGGDMNRAAAESMLRGYLAGYEKISVTVSDLTIDRKDEVAAVSFDAQLDGKPAAIGGLSGLLPNQSRVHFDMRFVPSGGKWKVAWAKWVQLDAR